MRRRWIGAVVLATFAAASMHPATEFSTQTVATLGLFAGLLLGAEALSRYAEALEGVKAGPVEVEPDEDTSE